MTQQDKFNEAIRDNNIKQIELLLNDKRIDPSNLNNFAIRFASENGQTEIVNLLWSNQRIKDTLQNDNLELYNHMITKETINKLDEF